MSDQWPRAHLRAALREVGYDAIGTRDLKNALRIAAVEAGRGPVGLLMVDQRVLHDDAEALLRAVRERFADSRILLLAGATSAHPPGPWNRVLTRPLSVEEIVSAVQSALPLAQRSALD